MGCCQSNASGSRDEALSPHRANSISPLPGHNSSAQAPVPAPSVRPRNGNGNGANRPNKPLREPSPVARSPRNVSNRPPPWTRSHLERERAAFFETRVTGTQEIWAALRTASEFLCVGDLASGQAILDAVNVSCPTGKFARARGRERVRGGLYDESGALYDIPEWVVTDPRDIVEDTEDKIGIDGGEDSDDAHDNDDAARRREEKGKGRAADLGEETRAKVRFSDGKADLEVVFGAKQNAGVLVRKILEQRGERVTLLHLGKKIDEKQTLEAQGWRPGTILNGFLHRKEDVP